MSDHEDVDMGGALPSNARQLKDTQNDLSDDEMGTNSGPAAAASLTDFPAPLQIDSKGKGKLQEEASTCQCTRNVLFREDLTDCFRLQWTIFASGYLVYMNLGSQLTRVFLLLQLG